MTAVSGESNGVYNRGIILTFIAGDVLGGASAALHPVNSMFAPRLLAQGGLHRITIPGIIIGGFESRGMTTFLDGAGTNMIRHAVKTSTMLSTYDITKRIVNASSPSVSTNPVFNVVLGAMSCVAAQAVVQPLEFARAEMMMNGKYLSEGKMSYGKYQYRGLVDVFRKHGVRTMATKGLAPSLAGAAIYGSIYLGFYDIYLNQFPQGSGFLYGISSLFLACSFAVAARVASYPLDTMRWQAILGGKPIETPLAYFRGFQPIPTIGYGGVAGIILVIYHYYTHRRGLPKW